MSAEGGRKRADGLAARVRAMLIVCGALLAGASVGSTPALAACGPDVAGTVTCTGTFPSDPNNASAGLPTTTLNVNSLTADIVPDAGEPGVEYLGLRPNGPDGEDHDLADGDDAGAGQTGPTATINYVGGSFDIITSNAPGIIGVSRGGNGGEGGFSGDVDANGGRGGDGGTGGTMIINASGEIQTTGANAHGILGQSIGGNGGRGGNAAGIDATGGNGGNAAGGGTVTILSSSTITTNGDQAHGIFGQSVGGRGGSGGDGDGIVGDGGNGGTAAPGGTVDITNTGTIVTHGAQSYGILASSVGGFGGDGGDGGGLVAFGSDGASAGNGGTVTVTNSGAITTGTAGSHGILAQSIGGGGGSGGSGGALVGFGGGASPGGSGGSVTVTNNVGGTIHTQSNDAHGIFAQSVGGGGGNGGSAGGLVSFGGNGSSTSPGGIVTVTNAGAITTEGERSHGVLAQSIGGGGGSGGFGAGLVTIGGSGAGGGEGGAVTANVTGTIVTGGNDSVGIFAESIGGGGGSGGGAYAGGLNFAVAIGGAGGVGSKGGTVLVNPTMDVTTGPVSTITTTGDRSHGIQAQSVGGGGGNGGMAIAGSIDPLFSTAVTVGGTGGPGGAGGIVTVNERGTITTGGDQAYGIFAQSVGGGGGSGGGTISASVSTNSIGVAMGGKGGSAGNGDTVTVNARGSITTTGELAHGILAQSVGGGGGAGGYSIAAAAGGLAGTVSLGGDGGGAGNGGFVNVTTGAVSDTNRTIETTGNGAAGIFAQSVGGGGGSGGISVAAAGGAGALSVGLGGQAGGGGFGSTVTVTNGTATTNAADIITHGNNASGILAQSVGGGGGNGGFTFAGAGGVMAGSAAVGGDGGAGGAGGAVIVDTYGDITTEGTLSYGILAQSVGGGGGNGGSAIAGSLAISVEGIPAIAPAVAIGGSGDTGGVGSRVNVTNGGSIETGGAGAHGIFAQSVGGGGGSGGFAGSLAIAAGQGGAFAVAVGGSGAGGGTAGTSTVTSTGATIDTHENGAHGIFAQSVGGGGGDGGFGLALAGAFGGGNSNLAASVAIGGNAGAGGDGNVVTVTNHSAITTEGANARGIFAQSVGGGGGSGGFAIGVAGSGSASATVNVGGSGGTGAIGQTVTVTNRNAITTTGEDAAAIVAQSIGGGGGSGGFTFGGAGGQYAIAVAVGGTGAGGGNGGAVTVDSTGAINTTGGRSYGILAQSVGGGGGSGGGSVAGTLAIAADNPSLAASVAVGGSGGTASKGETVTVTNAGTIETRGAGAHAIFAQSVGGGGGDGGFAGTLGVVVGEGGAFGVSVGGGGGPGGDGGIVSVTSTGATIITHEDGANGILAQSVGGGGGDGGFALALSAGFSGEEEKSLAVSVAVGGSGDVGGIGQIVTVDNQSAITTYGIGSNAIFAQSVGGGGGTGGFAASGSIAVSETPGNVGVTVGGNGGDGGTAAKVTVTNDHALTTNGRDGVGILAQSIGGSGGNGGLALTTQMTFASQDSASIGVAVGGGGGDGNTGGEVQITNNVGGDIHTIGVDAHGIFAQSVGGGGGNGGLALVGQLGVSGGSEEEDATALNIGVTVGGGGGEGNFAQKVTIDNFANIDVGGVGAMGIVGQSIGGGGGFGGGAVTALGVISDNSNDDNNTLVATVTIGGAGGDGNNGGAVDILNEGNITTRGASGYGIYAESIGGGGGLGGRANTVALVVSEACSLPLVCDSPAAQKNNYQAGVTIGGNGGGASNGGQVTVDNTGNIETLGDTSDGIFAQSVGGGGGNGGNGILGTEGILPVPAELIFIPVGSVSFYKNYQAVVGGSGGSSGNGGLVEVTNSGNITTRAGNSNGIFAQSIGGGGGVAGKAAVGATGTLGIGGEGGSGGNGGVVTVDHTDGTIETFGIASWGIVAQSVGGGGGMAGNVQRTMLPSVDTPVGATPALNVGLNIALGRSGGAGGDGGNITVGAAGDVITHGDFSTGIFAQSVGGAGGVLGELGNLSGVTEYDPTSWRIGSAGQAGSAGTVDVTVDGNIRTAGFFSTGVFAQSAGGTGTASDVTVTVNGSVKTAETLAAGDENRGVGSIAILAQSVAGDNADNGNVIVNIGSETDTDAYVQGGRTLTLGPNLSFFSGVGIYVIDGDQNEITNYGTVTTIGGVESGWAIVGAGSDATHLGGSELVSNFGTVTGSFDLGVGANSFTIEEPGVLNSGRIARVGEGNTLTNNGRMSPGADGKVMTTSITGAYEQGATGEYSVDLDLWWTGDTATESREADRILVVDLGGASAKANMAGTVDLSLYNTGNALPGTHEVLLVHADNGVDPDTDANLALVTPASAVATYDLIYPNANDVVLSYTIDFAPAGLTPNEAAFGQQINQMQLAFARPTDDPGADKDTPMTELIAALYAIPDLETLAAAYGQLVPAVYVGNQIATIYSNSDFHDSLHSCRTPDGSFRFIEESSCAWFRFGYRAFDRETTDLNAGFGETAYGYSAGIQRAFTDSWAAGFGLSYETTGLVTDNDDTTVGQRVQGGVAFKGRWDDTMLATSFSAGYGLYNSIRFVDFQNIQELVEGEQQLLFGGAHARLSHAFEGERAYLRPSVDAGVTLYHLYDFVEEGSPLVGLDVDASTQLFYNLSPSIELGSETPVGEALLRSYVRAGMTQYFGDAPPQIAATLQQAPAGVQPSIITDDLADQVYEITAGIDLILPNGFMIRADGNYEWSNDIENYGGSIKISGPLN